MNKLAILVTMMILMNGLAIHWNVNTRYKRGEVYEVCNEREAERIRQEYTLPDKGRVKIIGETQNNRQLKVCGQMHVLRGNKIIDTIISCIIIDSAGITSNDNLVLLLDKLETKYLRLYSEPKIIYKICREPPQEPDFIGLMYDWLSGLWT